MSKPRIGFVGVGLMGHGIARNLIAKGFPVTLRLHRNRKPAEDLLAAGAREVGSYAELARNVDIVMLCVTGAPQVEEVVLGPDGIASGGRDGLIVIDTSTSEPATTTRMRNVLGEQAIRFVDAPLARTPVEAEQGRLNIMVGADEATFEELKPVFAAFCENIVHAGPAGHGIILGGADKDAIRPGNSLGCDRIKDFRPHDAGDVRGRTQNAFNDWKARH